MTDSILHHDGRGVLPRAVATDVAYLRDRIVNVVFVGARGAGDREWVLIDTGLPGSAARIKRAAAAQFAQDARPSAIILTHGHFDHIGAIHTLVRDWDVPVYAHELELPYLTSRSAYPPPHPLVGGGAMSLLSFLYPRRPIDLQEHVHPLPADGSVPGMPGWRWIFTPGHAPGHVSFVRDADRTLIAGDAFVTTKQESMIAALTQRAEVHGPPMYFTPDWGDARQSVRHLAEYAPSAAVTGHGPPMRGPRLREELHRLSSHFDALARPAHGRYRDRPAITDVNGVVDLPPAQVSARTVAVTGLAVGAAVGLALVLSRRDRAPAITVASDLGTDLARADGGYDASAGDTDFAPPSPG